MRNSFLSIYAIAASLASNSNIHPEPEPRIRSKRKSPSLPKYHYSHYKHTTPKVTPQRIERFQKLLPTLRPKKGEDIYPVQGFLVGAKNLKIATKKLRKSLGETFGNPNLKLRDLR